MELSATQLQSLQLPVADECLVSQKQFAGGGQYRFEIPSTEGPRAFRMALEEADRIGLPIHRVSQGSGIQMLEDEDIREMARIGADRCIEVNLFVTPRAGFEIGGLWPAPAGKFIQWQNRGAAQLRYCLDDINRAVELGIRSVLLADIGLIQLVAQLRSAGQLPSDLIIKSSAVMSVANPASVRLLQEIGTDTINVATDLSVTQLSAIRQVVDVPLDIYVEAPDGLGGFVRHHETPEIIRYAAPVFVKLGLRNAPDIYPAGYHLDSTVLNLSRERARRSKLVYDLIRREAPELVLGSVDEKTLGVPRP